MMGAPARIARRIGIWIGAQPEISTTPARDAVEKPVFAGTHADPGGRRSAGRIATYQARITDDTP